MLNGIEWTVSTTKGQIRNPTSRERDPPPRREKEQTVLSEQRNIVVIADAANRSRYGFPDSLARHMGDAMQQASFIGFTGTPIELKDANTRAVF